jgi:hypothetical protein
MKRENRLESGFTLLEVLLATAIAMSVVAAVVALLNPARGVFRTEPETAELQQRLRTGVETLSHDLVNAGAGAYIGEGAGTLLKQFAPILPFRRGRDADIDDGAGVFRNDAITILYVAPTAIQASLKADMASPSSGIVIDAGPGCPRDDRSGVLDPLCGVTADVTKAALFDGTGAVDAIAVTSADEATASIGFQHPLQPLLSKAYLGKSSHHVTRIVEISSHVYYLNASTRQLMHSDGFAAVTPVLDNVGGLEFEYFGEASPPAFLHPGKDLSVTYGPSPPPLESRQVPFAPGENCLWLVSDGTRVSRLAPLDAAGGLVRLTSSQLTDGPWCPDDANDRRYDADLFRIRQVRVRLRLRSGSVTENTRTAVPDLSVSFDVSPRNLNLGR